MFPEMKAAIKARQKGILCKLKRILLIVMTKLQLVEEIEHREKGKKALYI